jgi:hypothetical protein
MQATAAILSEFRSDGWHSRLLSGPALQRVFGWIEKIDSNPALTAHASGKPLAWLLMLTGLHQSDQQVRVIRKIGLMTDVLRTSEQELTPENLSELEDLFARHGKPFRDGSTDTPPFL